MWTVYGGVWHYSKIHEKAYKLIVCEFGGFQNVLCDAYVRAIPT